MKATYAARVMSTKTAKTAKTTKILPRTRVFLACTKAKIGLAPFPRDSDTCIIPHTVGMYEYKYACLFCLYQCFGYLRCNIMSFTYESPDLDNGAVGEVEMESTHIIGLAKRGKHITC